MTGPNAVGRINSFDGEQTPMLAGNGPSPEIRFPLPGVQRLGFLRQFITRPTIIVGDYTYYDDPRGPEHFEGNILYHFDFIGDRLIIGKYCSIAAETTFFMNGGNHITTWLTTYPFPIFGHGWEAAVPPSCPRRGDTVERLMAIAWWDWDAEKVTRNVRAICSGDAGSLEQAD